MKAIKDAKTLDELAAACKLVGSKLEDDMNKLKQKAAAQALRLLVYTTPVDTSLALSNWQVSALSPDAEQIDAYFDGEQGSTKSASAAAAYTEGLREIKVTKPRKAIYIVNVVSYITDLERGSSPQGSGFVERTVTEVQEGVNIYLRRYAAGLL